MHPHHFGLPELFWLGQPPPQQRTGAALAVKSLDWAYPVGAKAEEPQQLEHVSPHLVLACPVEPGNTVEAGAEDASTEVPCSGEASTEASMLVLARPVEEACFKPPVAATSPPPSVPLWQRLGGGAPVTAPPAAPPAFVPPRTDEPYSAAIAYVQALPRFASPRQKLRLLADACTEAARCVERHHRSTASTMPAAVPGRPPPYPLPVDNPPRTPPRSPPRTPGSRTPTRMRSGDGLRRLPSWHVGLSAAEGGDLPLRRLPSLHIPVEVAAAAAADWEVAAARAVEEEMAEMAARQEAMEAEAAGEGGEAEEAEEELEGEEETTFDQAATMAADDLIPVMSYVLARARMPQVLSEVRFVEAFARGAGEEGLLLGRLGYGLATFQAALQLLGSAELDPAAIAAMEPGAASEAAARADARARGRSCGLQLEPAAALADMRRSIACGGKRRPSGGAAEWERSLLADLVFRRSESEDPDKADDDSDSFKLAFPKSNSWPESLQRLEGQQSVRTHGQLGFGLGGSLAGLMAVASVVEMAALNPHRRPPSPLLEAIAEAPTEATTEATTEVGAETEAASPSESDGGLWKWW